MKILLRDWADEQYVWKTAKYNNGSFHVDGEPVRQTNVVSIINDNRKNYIQCSCCGRVFKKGDTRFEIHKKTAINPETCFGCNHLIVDAEYANKETIVKKADGSFVRKLEQCVRLTCAKSGMWEYDNITSDSAIFRCKKRQCEDATETEISDFFTRNPGVFDDILTIDALLDQNYEAYISNRYSLNYCDIIFEEDYTIGVAVNQLGIIDRFYVWYRGDRYCFFYSKKYDELLCETGGKEYTMWENMYISNEMRNEIKAKIAAFYN